MEIIGGNKKLDMLFFSTKFMISRCKVLSHKRDLKYELPGMIFMISYALKGRIWLGTFEVVALI
jgi:hypothetical protein